MRKIQRATMKRSSGRIMVLWGSSEKELPLRSEVPESLDEDDDGFWYDREYAGRDVQKVNIPVSPKNGAAGKHLIYIQPGPHHYMDEYADNLKKKAGKAGIRLEILDSSWDDAAFDRNVNLAIDIRPHMILLNPENQQKSSVWYKRINQAGIPVIGGNFLPDSEAFSYLLAWTGPDDWGQSRLLARDLAKRMNRQGNYAILQHHKGTSSYYARTYGFIAELKKQAPRMYCLDRRSPEMNREESNKTVKEWILSYGWELQSIVCSDDEQVLQGVVDALKETGREDILCVAPGSSRHGLKLLEEGKVEALTYQSAAIDGSTAMQTIIDWFEGVPVEPIRYLPCYIIHQEEASDFLESIQSVESINLDILYRAILSYEWEAVYEFFGDVYEKFLQKIVVPLEDFQAFCLEVLAGLIIILKENQLSIVDTLGSYDSMVKHLLRDKDISSLLQWINGLALELIDHLMISHNRKTPIQRIVDFLEDHYREALSLKTLALEFNYSQAYLGQLFREETGEKFNDYLNKKRIARARCLLLGKNVKANQVALDLGYSDPAYFYKLFKKYTGQSVSEYIKENS